MGLRVEKFSKFLVSRTRKKSNTNIYKYTNATLSGDWFFTLDFMSESAINPMKKSNLALN